MSPRLKLRAAAKPLVMAGALWAGSALAPIAQGGGAQTPPPCNPDGVCVPRPQTFGWYQTRWRTFPGDVATTAPTPAEGAEKSERPELGGPDLPEATEEGQLGPAPSRREGAAPGGAAPAEGEAAPAEDATEAGLGTLPGEAPLPGFDLPGQGPPLPGAEGTPPAEGAPPAGTPEADPGAAPGTDPLDPFGGAPPAPPAWISNAALRQGTIEQTATAPLPVVEYAAVIAEATEPAAPTQAQAPMQAPPQMESAPLEIQMPAPQSTPALDGPNLYGGDAPPTLPPALAGRIGVAVHDAAVTPASGVAPRVQQPMSVEPTVQAIADDRVTTASAEEPVGIQLVNPAGAMVDPDAGGLQQAIYFEASDQ